MNIPKGFKYKDNTPVDLKFAANKINKDVDRRARELYLKNTEQLTKHLLTVAFHVFHDEFGFGDVRLTRFKDGMIKQLEMIADDYVDWSDFAGNVRMIEK